MNYAKSAPSEFFAALPFLLERACPGKAALCCGGYTGHSCTTLVNPAAPGQYRGCGVSSLQSKNRAPILKMVSAYIFNIFRSHAMIDSAGPIF